MITVRRCDERAHFDHGWLDTHHTFSFAGYYDPAHMGFRALRVINEDRVKPGQGFGTHGHRDMEILSVVLSGALAHRDSTGAEGVLRPGEVQRMSAGSGIRHSEFNASREEEVHFLQIWLEPAEDGIPPSYQQEAFPEAERRGRLQLIASPERGDGLLLLHQDARVYAALLEQAEQVSLPLAKGRHAWLQVARGEIDVNGIRLVAGDGAAVVDEHALTLAGVGREPAEFLAFDLA
ncbi:MAG TPA: pirin family protein [Anaeromyxobacteraceae bacterium]|nr:pirin family protein [Anaeromyxobacteraceae bacterium]